MLRQHAEREEQLRAALPAPLRDALVERQVRRVVVQHLLDLRKEQARLLLRLPRRALLHRAYNLAVEKKKIGRGCVPVFPKLTPGAARQGFFTRAEVEDLTAHLDDSLADMVRFLFYSAWRVGEARQLEWRDYNRTGGELRLREELSKNGEPRVLPIVGELALILERRLAKRRLDCPSIFHRDGQPIGDFRKAWRTACKAIGLAGRIVHDLRRSGVKHLIDAGVDPHTVMAFSGHKTASMLRRYHIINLADLRRAALRGSAYTGEASQVAVLKGPRTRKG
jgi:integrase